MSPENTPKPDPEEIEEQRIREKLKKQLETDSVFGRYITIGESVVFEPYDEKTIIKNLRKKGYKITEP